MYDEDVAHPNELRAQRARSLLIRLFGALATLAGQEYDLVTSEVAQSRSRLAGVGVSAGLTVAACSLALLWLSAAAVGGLALVVGLPLAALVLGAVFAVVGIALSLALRRAVVADLMLPHTLKQFRLKRPVPTKSLDEQEADIAWTRSRVDDSVSALKRKGDLVQPLRDTAAGMGALGIAVANIVRESAEARN